MGVETPSSKLPEHLPLGVMTALQIELIEQSGMDPAQWSDRYAKIVRELVEGDPELAALVLRDQHAAVSEVQRRLTSELPY